MTEQPDKTITVHFTSLDGKEEKISLSTNDFMDPTTQSKILHDFLCEQFGLAPSTNLVLISRDKDKNVFHTLDQKLPSLGEFELVPRCWVKVLAPMHQLLSSPEHPQIGHCSAMWQFTILKILNQDLLQVEVSLTSSVNPQFVQERLELSVSNKNNAPVFGYDPVTETSTTILTHTKGFALGGSIGLSAPVPVITPTISASFTGTTQYQEAVPEWSTAFRADAQSGVTWILQLQPHSDVATRYPLTSLNGFSKKFSVTFVLQGATQFQIQSKLNVAFRHSGDVGNNMRPNLLSHGWSNLKEVAVGFSPTLDMETAIPVIKPNGSNLQEPSPDTMRKQMQCKMQPSMRPKDLYKM